MKKRIILAIFVLLLIFSLVGCSKTTANNDSGYPYTKIYQSGSDITKIKVGNQYKLKDYDKEYTETGCIIKINFENKQKESNVEKENDQKEKQIKQISTYKLDVTPVLQLPELPTGCEITSLATVLNYYGYDISKTQLADEYLDCGKIGQTDPDEKFIGSPYDEHSCGCYSNVIADAARDFSIKNNCNFKIYNLNGLSLDELYKYIENGSPVIVWATIDLMETYRNITWNIDGKEIAWRANEHCMVLIGYDKDNDTCIVSDPLKGIMEYPKELFNQRYEELGKQAVILVK